MISKFFKSFIKYVIIILALGIVFYGVKEFRYDDIMEIDEWFINFIHKYIECDFLTIFMKCITNFGGVIAFVIILILFYLLVKNKKIVCSMTINLFIAYIVSVIFKNIFMRERPLNMLISRPRDYSFPSGHTICSIVFYGYLIYIVNRYVKDVNKRRVINIFLVMIMVLVPFSRIYLGVHYFTDVIGGLILGFTCLLCFINYVKIEKII